MGTGSSFLAFAIMAGKRGIDNPVYHHKSLYYLGGLTEGSETIALFVLMCLWPAAFAPLAYGFALLCAITTLTGSGAVTTPCVEAGRRKGPATEHLRMDDNVLPWRHSFSGS